MTAGAGGSGDRPGPEPGEGAPVPASDDPPTAPGGPRPSSDTPAGPTRRGPGDRAAGAVLLVLAAAVAAEGSTFDVGFLTDPLGPKALPWLVAGILGAAALHLVLRPGPPPNWPSRRTLGRLALAVIVFLAYAPALALLGFLAATTLAVGALSVLFGGPAVGSLAAAGAFSVVLWAVFVHLLGLPLPVGWILTGGQG